MFVSRIVPTSLTAIALAASINSVSVAGQSAKQEATTTVTSTDVTNAQPASSVDKTRTFSTMARVNAEPMTSTELNNVKGMHVHFIVPTSQNDQYFGVTGLHLAGNLFEHNWENLGGTDPAPVAPSYHGLCTTLGTPSPILIPFTPAGTQCP